MKKILLIALGLTLYSFASAQDSKGMTMSKKAGNTPMHKEGMADMQGMMLPMAFFTHMGMPLNVGTYSLRAAALPTRSEDATHTEFNFQFETGLSKTIGLFLGGEGLFEDATLEAMVNFLAWKSQDGMSGFSPLIEFEFPLGKGAKRDVYTLIGFASTFSNTHVAFHQVLHYSPLEDLAEGSAALVIKASKRIFLVPEISGVFEKGTRPISNLLLGVKVKLNNNFLLGFAYQLPLTVNRDYDSQFVLQPHFLFQP
jgi:hypothetical protein